MVPISGVSTGAAQPLTAAEKVLGAPKVQKPEEETQGRPLKPVMDEYVPEEPQEPSGRYWMGKDEDGQPKIYFDDPERAADAPKGTEAAPNAKKPDADIPKAEDPEQDKGAKGPEKKGGEKEKCDTGKVDREIEKLKKKQKELEQRLNTETDETKIKELERQLAQVERELKQKDSDAYRKQHSTFTRLS
ncbi:MAG: hypothetical protein K2O45_00510 [Oscillospiraceae bacterium]|nr:hypothetical protein [Oscillospiraceae bacterium]